MNIIITLSRQQEADCLLDHREYAGTPQLSGFIFWRKKMLKVGEWIDKIHEIADALEYEQSCNAVKKLKGQRLIEMAI